MRVIYQRVSAASVTVDGTLCGTIEKGAVLLVGIGPNDTEEESRLLAKKCAETRVFSDENDKMNLSVKDIDGGFLVIPNFTLYGSCRHGRRPDFTGAGKPEMANALFERFKLHLQENDVPYIASGIFGADMKLDIQGDGPVTLILDSEDLKPNKKD